MSRRRPGAALLLGALASACSTGARRSSAEAGIDGDAAATDPGDATAEVRVLAPGPSHLGTVDAATGCVREYPSEGHAPVAAGGRRFPLFLYLPGTNFLLTRDEFRVEYLVAARAVTEAMARRGFVALAVDYDNGPAAWLSDHAAQLDCLFSPAEAGSIVARACALPEVDCGLGIATWGHSQGALLAHRAHDLDARVAAAWVTGYGGDAAATLPPSRLRVVNAEADFDNGSKATLDRVAGFDPSECADEARHTCLRPDGSGWVRVLRADCVTSSADHCWFDRSSCSSTEISLEPSFVAPDSPFEFSLRKGADFVAARVRAR